jgi:hypothetical protein
VLWPTSIVSNHLSCFPRPSFYPRPCNTVLRVYRTVPPYSESTEQCHRTQRGASKVGGATALALEQLHLGQGQPSLVIPCPYQATHRTEPAEQLAAGRKAMKDVAPWQICGWSACGETKFSAPAAVRVAKSGGTMQYTSAGKNEKLDTVCTNAQCAAR